MGSLSLNGRTYTFDTPGNPAPRKHVFATPTLIPIHCDPRSHYGPLDICKTVAPRTTEIAALFPKRGGAYDPHRNLVIETRPGYFNEVGEWRYKIQCTCCMDYQRREAFSPDTRKRNGLASVCKTCHAGEMRMRRSNAA